MAPINASSGQRASAGLRNSLRSRSHPIVAGRGPLAPYDASPFVLLLTLLAVLLLTMCPHPINARQDEHPTTLRSNGISSYYSMCNTSLVVVDRPEQAVHISGCPTDAMASVAIVIAATSNVSVRVAGGVVASFTIHPQPEVVQNFMVAFHHARIQTSSGTTIVELTATRLENVHLIFSDCRVDINNTATAAAAGQAEHGLWVANISGTEPRAGNSAGTSVGAAGGLYNCSIKVHRSVVHLVASSVVAVSMGAVSIHGSTLSNVSVQVSDSTLTAMWMGVLSQLYSGPESIAQVVLLRGGRGGGSGSTTSSSPNNVAAMLSNCTASLAASAGVFLVSVVGGAAFGGGTIAVAGCTANLTARGPRTPLVANGIGAGLKREAAVVACESCVGVTVVLRATNATMRMFFNPTTIDRQSILSDGMIGSAVRVLVFVASTVLLEDCQVQFALPADAGQPMGLVAILGLSLVSVLPGSTAPEDPSLLNVGITIANTTMAVDFAQEVSDGGGGGGAALCAYPRTIVVQQDITLTTSVIGVVLCIAHVIGSAHSTNVSVDIAGSTSLDVPTLPSFDRCGTNPSALASYRGTITLRVLLPAANYSIVGFVWFGSLDGVLINIVRTMLVDPLLSLYFRQLPPPTSIWLTNLSASIHPSGPSARLEPLARLAHRSIAVGGSLLGAVVAMSHARVDGMTQPGSALTIRIGAYCAANQPLLALALVAVDIASTSNSGGGGGHAVDIDVDGSGADASSWCGGYAAPISSPTAIAYLDRVASLGATCVFTAGMQRPPACAETNVSDPTALVPVVIALHRIAALRRNAFAFVVVNNVSASIAWTLGNLSMMDAPPNSAGTTVFAAPPPSPLRVAPLLFAWSAASTITIDCVAINDADVSDGTVYPRSSSINFNVSWLQSHRRLEIRPCPSTTKRVSLSSTMSRSNTLPYAPYQPSSAFEQPSEVVASLVFPIAVMVLMCLLPSLVPAALALQRCTAIVRVGKMMVAAASRVGSHAAWTTGDEDALTFLENPLGITLSSGATGQTAGALVSIATACIVWGVGIAIASLVGSRIAGGRSFSGRGAAMGWYWLTPLTCLVVPWVTVSVFALGTDSIAVGAVGCCVAGVVLLGAGRRLLLLPLAELLPFRYVPRTEEGVEGEAFLQRVVHAAMEPSFDVHESAGGAALRTWRGVWLQSLLRCNHPRVHLKVYALHMLLATLSGIAFGLCAAAQPQQSLTAPVWCLAAISLLHLVLVAWLRPYTIAAPNVCLLVLEAINIGGAVCFATATEQRCEIVGILEGAVALPVLVFSVMVSLSLIDPHPAKSELQTSMYTCFLSETTPTTNISQDDWDKLKRLLYARIMPSSTEMLPDTAAVVSQSDALEQLVRLACSASAPRNQHDESLQPPTNMPHPDDVNRATREE